MKYTKEISMSEAKYFINSNDNKINLGGGKQGSYNLPIEFFEDAKKYEVLIEDSDIDYCRKKTDGNAFIINDQYSFKLGNGVLWLIGDEYEKKDNKFIASRNGTNNKFQLYRTVYNGLNKEYYGWFVKLYDKNLAGNELILEIDIDKKVFTLDIGFRGVSQSIEKNKLNTNFEEINKIYKHNRIIFGAPGTGKSYKLEEDRLIFGDNFERVTFHPNYSYSQFVGTYKPVPEKEKDINGVEVNTITYKYVPGPFMRTYVKAIKSLRNNEDNAYLLLIEEINRANVAAVFGDMFQLLDRKNGESEYEIETSEDMRVYLANELNGNEADYKKIKIPSNMYIWATMNSADQGVFPMDTAFKRRWNFEYIGINENSEGIKDIIVKLGKDKHEVKWNDLRMAINDRLSRICKVNEDKLLGPYFLSKDVIATSENDNYVLDNEKFIESFKSKIIMYLYEDAAKQNKSILFAGCKDYHKYSSVCEEFDEIGEYIFGEDILDS